MLKKLFVFILLLAIIISICIPLATNFLRPFLKEKFLNVLESGVGREIELSGFDISLLRGIIFLEGLKIKNPKPIKYYSSVAADEIILDVDLLFAIFKRDIVFQRIFLKGLTFRLKNREIPQPPLNALPALQKQNISGTETNLPKSAFNDVYIRKLIIEDSEFIFRDYSVTPSPTVIEIIDINGRLENLYAQFGDNNLLKGTARLNGRLNSAHEGLLEMAGSFTKSGDEIDFDLRLNLDGVNLIRFSPYYSETSFTILKEAKVDLRSKALCRKNRLDARQSVRIYEIELDDTAPTDEDMLFSLPAKTVIDFFKNSRGEVEFDFNLVGSINDPKFDPGPLVQKLLSEALHEKIMAALRELPREMIRIGEKAIREGLEGEKFEEFEKLKKNIKRAGKKFKKLIEKAD